MSRKKEAVTGPKQDVAKLLITIAEAAALTGVCQRTLWARTKSGEIPCRYIGRAVRYVPEELIAWRDGLPRQRQ